MYELHLGRLIDHVHLRARDLEATKRFYRAVLGALGKSISADDAGLAPGGRDNGEPGERPYHPGYFGAFLLDPDGNNIEAVHHGRAERSAESVVIRL